MSVVALLTSNRSLSKSVVLKHFGSWATFVFQKPFAGQKRINNLNKNSLKNSFK